MSLVARAGGYAGRRSDAIVAQGWSRRRVRDCCHPAIVARRLALGAQSLPAVAQAHVSVERWVCAAVWCALGALALRPLTTSSARFVVAGALVVLGLATVWAMAHFFGIGCAGAAGGAVLAAFNWCSIVPFDAGLPSLESTAGLGATLVSGSLLGRRAACRRRPADTSAVGASYAAHLAAEHEALVRVATVGAVEPSPTWVFGSITHEVGTVLGLDLTALLRHESDATATLLAAWSRDDRPLPVGSRWQLGQDPASAATEAFSELGMRSSVAAPLVVEGRVWGQIVGGSCARQPLGEDARRRLHRFMRLTESAVASAVAREQLAASRARIVASADTARRQIERDLHDGVQQRLVSLALDVRRVEALVEPGAPALLSELRALRDGLGGVVNELRDVCHGIHPSTLTEAGLHPALAQLARRSPLPVTLDVKDARRLPEPVEVCLYYVASEALTNAIKHARATHVVLDLVISAGAVRLDVSDDGVGGADVRFGSGLTGLADRLHTVGGALEVQSASDRGTRLSAHVPLSRAC